MFRTAAAGGLIVLVLFTLASTASSRDASATLKGVVGPGYTISLKQNGKKVKALKPGRYTFSVSDKSSIHNFTLEKEKGSHKFEKQLTGTGFTGTKTIAVKLTAGEFKYYCSVHESQMFGFFKVK
jgi:plastocyanin